MLQLLIQWLPAEVGTAALLIAISGAVVGAVLWLSGARFSRALVGLITVFIGAATGMALPRYLGWTISGAGPAVGLALILGLSGYIMHRFWIGLGLGLVLACWAFLTTWVFVHAPNHFGWPAITSNQTFTSFITQLWQCLPPRVASVAPVTCGIGLAAGLVAAISWPRMAIATAWSAAGISMLVGMGSAALEFGWPQWIHLLPRQPGSQAMALILLVFIGAAVQWKTAENSTQQIGPQNSPRPSESDSSDSRPVADGAD